MRRSVAWIAVVVLSSIGAASCGGDSPAAAPISPTPPTSTPPPVVATPPANRPPTITQATVTPASGISTLTTHAFSASASDPDGDAITYNWDLGNATTSGDASGTVTYTNATTTRYRPTLTVRDSRGETVTTTLSVTSVTIAGSWEGTIDGAPIQATMTQYLGGVVDGTWQLPVIGAVGEIGPEGAPGKIQANGQFELRFKVRVGSFNDFFYRGSINADGTTLTGTLQGSGFTGNTMILNKR